MFWFLQAVQRCSPVNTLHTLASTSILSLSSAVRPACHWLLSHYHISTHTFCWFDRHLLLAHPHFCFLFATSTFFLFAFQSQYFCGLPPPLCLLLCVLSSLFFFVLLPSFCRLHPSKFKLSAKFHGVRHGGNCNYRL